MVKAERMEGFWYVDVPVGNMIGIIEQREDMGYLVHIRIRTYVDDKVFNSNDKRTWYKIHTNDDSLGVVIDKVRQIFRDAPFATNYTEVTRDNRTVDEFMDDLKEQEFFHHQTVSLND